MWATTRTVSLSGATGHLIDVQVDVSDGVIAITMVGRPDASISEARDRCRSAVNNSGYHWPNSRRITILLSPADLPKSGPHFDLAIAVGVLAASDPDFPARQLSDSVLIGELTLDGRLRCVPGVLPMTLAASQRGLTRVFVPEPQAREAAMVPGMEVYGVRSLRQVVALLTGSPDIPDAPPVEPVTGSSLIAWRGENAHHSVDLADIDGMEDARYAVEVAATGGHHMFLSGPKGAGKTTLAERIPGILPDLTAEEALELTAIHSLWGPLPAQGLITRPPFRAPHHSASRTGVLGGGSGRVRPGDVSLAHLGVLFLDEFPLFPTDIIEALRQPLESGLVQISRGDERARFPARSMVVFAANPCPCGEYRPHLRDHRCDCGEVRRRNYRSKVTGPIEDRIDIVRNIEPPTAGSLGRDPLAWRDSTETVRGRVTIARARQQARLDGSPWRLNSDVPGPELRAHWPLTHAATVRLDKLLYAGSLTHRGVVRVQRLAWSVADVHGVERPGLGELEIALRLRTGEPLELSTIDALRRAG